jgi:transcription initiation factor TFIID subunit 12
MILPRHKLHELVRQVDPNQTLDVDVEELLLEMTNDFIERVVTFSCQLAKHRGSDTLEAKDVQLHLERSCTHCISTFYVA